MHCPTQLSPTGTHPQRPRLPSRQGEHSVFSSLQATAINLLPALDCPRCQQGRQRQLLNQFFYYCKNDSETGWCFLPPPSLCGVLSLAHTNSCAHLHHEWYKRWAATQQSTQGLQQ